MPTPSTLVFKLFPLLIKPIKIHASYRVRPNPIFP